jgi:hypothetical protein
MIAASGVPITCLNLSQGFESSRKTNIPKIDACPQFSKPMTFCHRTVELIAKGDRKGGPPDRAGSCGTRSSRLLPVSRLGMAGTSRPRGLRHHGGDTDA